MSVDLTDIIEFDSSVRQLFVSWNKDVSRNCLLTSSELFFVVAGFSWIIERETRDMTGKCWKKQQHEHDAEEDSHFLFWNQPIRTSSLLHSRLSWIIYSIKHWLMTTREDKQVLITTELAQCPKESRSLCHSVRRKKQVFIWTSRWQHWLSINRNLIIVSNNFII